MNMIKEEKKLNSEQGVATLIVLILFVVALVATYMLFFRQGDLLQNLGLNKEDPEQKVTIDVQEKDYGVKAKMDSLPKYPTAEKVSEEYEEGFLTTVWKTVDTPVEIEDWYLKTLDESNVEYAFIPVAGVGDEVLKVIINGSSILIYYAVDPVSNLTQIKTIAENLEP